jgi:hypothetical protein
MEDSRTDDGERMTKECGESTVATSKKEERQILDIEIQSNSDIDSVTVKNQGTDEDVQAKRRKTDGRKLLLSSESESGVSTTASSWVPPRVPSTVRVAPPSFTDIRKAVFDLVGRHGGKSIDPLYVAKTLGSLFKCSMEPMMGTLEAMVNEAVRAIRNTGERRSAIPPPITNRTTSDREPYEANWPTGQPCRLPPPPRTGVEYWGRDPRLARADLAYPKSQYEEWRRY